MLGCIYCYIVGSKIVQTINWGNDRSDWLRVIIVGELRIEPCQSSATAIEIEGEVRLCL